MLHFELCLYITWLQELYASFWGGQLGILQWPNVVVIIILFSISLPTLFIKGKDFTIRLPNDTMDTCCSMLQNQ